MTRTIPLALALLMAAPALASANTIDDRQDRQTTRIEHGRRTGDITWTEGLKLRKQQHDIARLENELKADGYLSKSDKARLTRKQNEASREIRALADNNLHRAWFLPRVGK